MSLELAKLGETLEHSVICSSEFTSFNPALEEQYREKFIATMKQVFSLFPDQRSVYLSNQIDMLKAAAGNEKSKLDLLKYISALSVVRDLLAQGWRICIESNSVKLAPPKSYRSNSKEYLRQQLHNERNAQFKNKSIKNFIRRMEKEKKYKDSKVNISNLICSGALIIKKIEAALENGAGAVGDVVQPYIQLVSNKACSETGYKLMDIWRYFRYTWSIPYKSTPGRNLFYLIRDASQPYHPIIGIAALGNCVLQLTNRDNYIGWTIEAIKNELKRKVQKEIYEEQVKKRPGLKRSVERIVELETVEEHRTRIIEFCSKNINKLMVFLETAIGEISTADLIENLDTENPSEEMVASLKKLAEDLKKIQLNNKRTTGKVNWENESRSTLYRKKRAIELAKLLEARIAFSTVIRNEPDAVCALNSLLNLEKGRFVNTALQANRKSKIGSNMMEIIVCGAIPPYNEILAGKLVALLMSSPKVIREYNDRYAHQTSEIASRMKGEKIVRDSRLAFLGTTSLYQTGSSQYNRIKMPLDRTRSIEYKKLGETEGFGSVFYSQDTTKILSSMVQMIDGGRKINNVFGEGTSPRLRLIRSGLSAIGVSSEAFLKHHTKRIVYGIDLATNTREFLNGEDEELNYLFPLNGAEEEATQEIINFWRNRWLTSRLTNPEIINRLATFTKQGIMLSKYF